MRSILHVPAACNPIYRYHIEFAGRTEENDGEREKKWLGAFPSTSPYATTKLCSEVDAKLFSSTNANSLNL